MPTDAPPEPRAATPGNPNDVRQDPDADRGVIAAAAAGEDLDATEQMDALEWLLADEEEQADQDAQIQKALEINVGTDSEPRWVKWTIGAIPEEEIKRIRRMASGNRASRRGGGEWDQDEFNLRVVTVGTVDPDPMALARKRGIADPATALRMRFRKKWGLITLLAGEVVALSGMDDEAVRDAVEVRAAGS